MTKRFPDWYKLQKDVQGWDTISPDAVLTKRLAQYSLTINFDYCHYGLKNSLREFECPTNQRPDFYIITDIELSKRPLSELFDLYQECYEKSKVGIYIAALSYYLEPERVFDNLTDCYSKNIDTVFREHLKFAHTVEDWSTMIDYPVEVANKEGIFREGSNYIFVHPNVKYFLWKTTEYIQ